MDVSKAIRTKRAVRQFTDEPVSEEIIREILQTARWSQSSRNSQPWEFIVITHREQLQKLSETGNGAGHMAGAAFAVVLASSDEKYWRSFDLGQVAACLQLAAWNRGIGSCIAYLNHEVKMRHVLGLPDDKFVRCGISFGYPLSEHKPSGQGGRKSIDDITHWNNW